MYYKTYPRKTHTVKILEVNMSQTISNELIKNLGDGFVKEWLSEFLPKAVSFTQNSAVLPGNMQASIFNGSSSVGYIVIAVIAFLLGAFVTVFCFRLKKWQEKKNREEDHDRND